MTTDAACVEANIDYGDVAGYMVRLDVEIPPFALNGRREDGGPMGCLLLTHEQADLLAQQLLVQAARVRDLRRDIAGPGPSKPLTD